MRFNLLLTGLLLLAGGEGITQTYHTNGSAYSENCNCYTLTNDQGAEAGSVWNKNQISLIESFDYKFDVNLGSRDDDGADGLAFVLQNISLSIGTTGEGMGFGGVRPSIGIVIDTYQNGNQHDPSYDHISINRDGDIDHRSSNNLSGPVVAVANNNNIEDGQWHKLRITWDAATKLLKAQVDGVDRVQTVIDLVADVFGNNPVVFWGFTAATGGSMNRQRFCTSLSPRFEIPAGQKTCFPEPVQFNDSSVTFGTILNWYWDFGDGTNSSVQAPAPHIFPSPGNYEVKLNILGNNGCVSDTFKQVIVIGSVPAAGFKVPAYPVCREGDVLFTDFSSVEYGTIDSWTWSVNGGAAVTGTNDFFKQSLTYGTYPATLQVTTKEGCVSDVFEKDVVVAPPPEVKMNFSDACYNTPVTFKAENINTAIPVERYTWNFGDGFVGNGQTAAHIYNKGSVYNLQLSALGENGCVSDTVQQPVTIYETHAFAGRDTIIVTGQPFQMNGSGGALYSWSPATGLSDAGIANPLIASVNQSSRYVLTAYTDIGCQSTDTINVRAIKGPAIYIPNAFTPNGDGQNDRFMPITAGITEIYYFRIFNRYGQMVYNSPDAGTGWDGTMNGKLQPAGTYVYTIKGKDFAGTVHEEKGTLVLIR